MIETSIWILAILYVLFMLYSTRRTIATSGIIIPPVLMSVVLFSLCMVAVFFGGWSSLHLLWLLLLSFVLGTVLLFFAPVHEFLFGFLNLLAIGIDLSETEIEIKTEIGEAKAPTRRKRNKQHKRRKKKK